MIGNKEGNTSPDKLVADFRKCLQNRASCHSEYYRRLSESKNTIPLCKQDGNNISHNIVEDKLFSDNFRGSITNEQMKTKACVTQLPMKQILATNKLIIRTNSAKYDDHVLAEINDHEYDATTHKELQYYNDVNPVLPPPSMKFDQYGKSVGDEDDISTTHQITIDQILFTPSEMSIIKCSDVNENSSTAAVTCSCSIAHPSRTIGTFISNVISASKPQCKHEMSDNGSCICNSQPAGTTESLTTTTTTMVINNKNKLCDREYSNISYNSTVGTATSSEASLKFDEIGVLNEKDSIRKDQGSLIKQRTSDLYSKQVAEPDTSKETQLTRDFEEFPRVERLIKMYTNLMQEKRLQEGDRSKSSDLPPGLDIVKVAAGDFCRNSPLSDEGCTFNQSPYSSDGEDNGIASIAIVKDKVARSSSSDSALGLDEEPAEPPANLNTGRRMTLTVTDLPLRPALLPLAEPVLLPDSPTSEQQQLSNAVTSLLTQTAIPSKVILEERVVEIPEDRFGSISSSRRESAQSFMSDYNSSECGGVRYVRTPSVVVSDYSDDVMCGITLEEIEYFRAQRMRRRSSGETAGTEKDDMASDVSASSSCSNLYYCGSTISALDGTECYINGVRMTIDRKISDCSTNSTVSGDEDDNAFSINDYSAEIIKPEDEHSCRKNKKIYSEMTAV